MVSIITDKPHLIMNESTKSDKSDTERDDDELISLLDNEAPGVTIDTVQTNMRLARRHPCFIIEE
jgi:hypothetical protein